MGTGAKSKGALGESIAASFLSGKGYEIIKRNYKSHYGEIDIIASVGSYIVFVEVKLRKSNHFGTPAQAVNKSKQERIKKTAYDYIADNAVCNKEFRFDVIELLGGPEYEINHIENAFG